MEQLFDVGSIFDGFLPFIDGRNVFLPMMAPVMGFGAPYRYSVQPMLIARNCSDEHTCNCAGQTAGAQTAELDDEMKKRRELQMQMRVAVENEEFEKAAELRDKLKELES